MFRHDELANNATDKKPEQNVKAITPAPVPPPAAPKTESERVIDLLEKNLKWSQIIYEQNRKINRKLLWTAVAGWLRFVLIVVPVLLALWYLPSFLRNFEMQYQKLVNPANPQISSTTTLQQLINSLPIPASDKDQLQTKLQ